jgi:hypothetical protein
VCELEIDDVPAPALVGGVSDGGGVDMLLTACMASETLEGCLFVSMSALRSRHHVSLEDISPYSKSNLGEVCTAS